MRYISFSEFDVDKAIGVEGQCDSQGMRGFRHIGDLPGERAWLLPNGLELCCPAAPASLLHSIGGGRGRRARVIVRQPGQHQRIVRRLLLPPTPSYPLG